jgi:predicted 3-demethylubiquinone-9 3-methyltransferase (glyoxalase superfamily)
MAKLERIAPCLWFDDQAEEAAKFYTGIFKNSRIVGISRYSKAGFEVHRRPQGSVMVVDFELDGQRFTALNGGPVFKFNEAISLQVTCADQGEIDYYWERLGEGGDPKAQQCGWLKDRYGLAWQVVPAGMQEMLKDHKSEKAERAMTAVMRMKKFDLAAYAGLRRASVSSGTRWMPATGFSAFSAAQIARLRMAWRLESLPCQRSIWSPLFGASRSARPPSTRMISAIVAPRIPARSSAGQSSSPLMRREKRLAKARASRSGR